MAEIQPNMRVPKTAELVAAQIRKRIICGELSEGDYLPLESELKTAFGISRPTLREAFRILEAENLISVVRGSRTGAQVHEPRVEAVSRYAGFVLQAQGTTVRDIYDARLAIEPFCARKLAEKKDLEAAAALEKEAEKLTALVEEKRYVDFMSGLADFHRTLVERAGNHTLLMITNMLHDVTARHQVEIFKRRPLDEALQRRSALFGIRSFHRLIEHIRQGDANRAEAHWRAHVENANLAWVPSEDVDRPLIAID